MQEERVLKCFQVIQKCKAYKENEDMEQEGMLYYTL